MGVGHHVGAGGSNLGPQEDPRDMAPDPTSGMIYGFWGMKSGLMDLGWPQTQYVSEGGFECHIFHVL